MLAAMGVVSVELALVRAGLPDLSLRPGTQLAARVADRHGSHGVLVLAGVPLVAELPDGLEAGTRLRLAVQEAAHGRLVLKVIDQPAAPPPPVAAPPPAVPLPLPNGAHARIAVTEEGRGGADGGEGASVSLRYESPSLGAIDLRLALGPGTVSAAVRTPRGAAHGAATDAAAQLRDALAAATGLAATVAVSERHDPFEAYA